MIIFVLDTVLFFALFYLGDSQKCSAQSLDIKNNTSDCFPKNCTILMYY